MSTPSIPFPSAWGQLTIKIRESRTLFDDSGNPTAKFIRADAMDGSTPPIRRGGVQLRYDFSTGQITRAIDPGAAVITTATAVQQTTISNAANVDGAILNAAVTAAAASVIEGQ